MADVQCSLKLFMDFPGGPVVKNLPSNAGDVGLIPGWGNKDSTSCGTTKPTCSRAHTP